MSQFKHIFFAVTAPYRGAMLVLLCPVAAAAAERPLSLEGAVDRALQETPQVVASAATLEAAQAVAPSAGRLPDPELVTGVDNLPVTGAERYSLTRDFMTMRKIGVMQSFPNGEKRRLQGERAHRGIAVEFRGGRHAVRRGEANPVARRLLHLVVRPVRIPGAGD